MCIKYHCTCAFYMHLVSELGFFSALNNYSQAAVSVKINFICFCSFDL